MALPVRVLLGVQEERKMASSTIFMMFLAIDIV